MAITLHPKSPVVAAPPGRSKAVPPSGAIRDGNGNLIGGSGNVGATTGSLPPAPDPTPIVPPAQPAPSQLQLRSRTFRANTEPLMPTWGTVKGLGAQLWVEEPTSDGGFLCMWAINYGPSSAITNNRFDTGTFATYGMIQGTHWNQYLGTATQAIDPIAAAWLGTRWTTLPYPNFANIVVAPFATVTAALGATGSQTVTPTSMADIRVGDVVSVQNSDGAPGFPGTNFERVTVTAITATTFTAVFASTKAANWQLVITTNIAYVVAHFPSVQPGQAQPNFESFRCDHDGLLVYDPLSDATITAKFFKAEPVLAHADYWTSKVYGKGEPVSSIDWSGSVAATTALQRFDIGGGVKRYQLGLKLPGKAQHDQNSDIIRSHGQGLTPVFNSGLWQFWMDWTQSPSGIVLTDAGPNPNILNKPSWRFSGRNSRPTRARVSYPNPNGIAKTEITPPNDDPLLAAGLVELVEKTWNIDGSPADDQSQRLARYFRKSSAIDRQSTIRVTNDGVRILPYIIVLVTSQRLHVTNAPMVVLNVANADPTGNQHLAWDVVVQPYDAAVHDDTQGSVTSVTSSTPVQLPFYSAAYVSLGMAASVGGRVVVGPSARLTIRTAAADTSILVDSPAFANGDVIFLQSITFGSPGTQQTEYMLVTSSASGSGPYTYSVTRNLDGSGADVWQSGDTVTGLGQTGSSFIDLYNARGLKSSGEIGPTIVGNVRDSSTYNAWTPRWAVGNLNGLFGYATNIYGAAFGVPTGAWLKIDPTNGVRIGFNATTKVQIDGSGNASFAGAVTADSGTIGGWTIGATSLTASAGKIQAGNVVIDVNGIAIPQGSLTAANGYVLKNGSTEVGGLYGQSDKIYVGRPADCYMAFDAAAGAAILGGPLFCIGGITTDLLSSAGTGYVNSANGFKVGGTKVVGARGAAVSDATNATDVITQLNALLARLRTHGLIA
jgi:hypothetical protein